MLPNDVLTTHRTCPRCREADRLVFPPPLACLDECRRNRRMQAKKRQADDDDKGVWTCTHCTFDNANDEYPSCGCDVVSGDRADSYVRMCYMPADVSFGPPRLPRKPRRWTARNSTTKQVANAHESCPFLILPTFRPLLSHHKRAWLIARRVLPLRDSRSSESSIPDPRPWCLRGLHITRGLG